MLLTMAAYGASNSTTKLSKHSHSLHAHKYTAVSISKIMIQHTQTENETKQSTKMTLLYGKQTQYTCTQVTHHDGIYNVVVVSLECFYGLVSAHVGLLNHQLNIFFLHSTVINLCR